jgi:hypothetical protein
VRKRRKANIIYEGNKKTEVREKWREVKLNEENAKSVRMKRMKRRFHSCLHSCYDIQPLNLDISTLIPLLNIYTISRHWTLYWVTDFSSHCPHVFMLLNPLRSLWTNSHTLHTVLIQLCFLTLLPRHPTTEPCPHPVVSSWPSYHYIPPLNHVLIQLCLLDIVTIISHHWIVSSSSWFLLTKLPLHPTVEPCPDPVVPCWHCYHQAHQWTLSQLILVDNVTTTSCQWTQLWAFDQRSRCLPFKILRSF